MGLVSKISSCVSDNKRYFLSDVSASVASYVSAGIASNIMIDSDHSTNALLTMAAKTGAFFIVKAGFHLNDVNRIAKSVALSGGTKSLFGMTGHYLLLASDVMPAEVSWLIAYGIPGIASGAIRYTLDYNSGLIKK